MFRRTFWMTVGAITGAWMVVKAQRAASRLKPSGALDHVARHLIHLRSDLGAALAEGRRTKRETELALRQAPRIRPAIDVAVGRSIPAVGPPERMRDPR